MRDVLLIDTSVMLEVLAVPGKSSESKKIRTEVEDHDRAGVELRLPLASVIETGGHIGRLPDGADRRRCAQDFASVIESTLEGVLPWSFRTVGVDEAFLRSVLGSTSLGANPTDMVDCLTTKYLQFGDLFIIAELMRLRANLVISAGFKIDVWTLDRNLRAQVDQILSS